MFFEGLQMNFQFDSIEKGQQQNKYHLTCITMKRSFIENIQVLKQKSIFVKAFKVLFTLPVIITMKILVSILILFIHLQARKLLFIESIFRHGIRYPIYPNDYDYSNITYARHSQGQIAVQGRQMLYLLGRTIYQKYWKLMFEGSINEKKYDNSLIYARSTNRNRTIQSLENLLKGLLVELEPMAQLENLKTLSKPPFEGYVSQIESDKSYESWKNDHLVPIHVQKGAQNDPGGASALQEGDFLVKQESNLCPNQPRWLKENLASPFFTKLSKRSEVQKAVQKLKPFYPEFQLDVLGIAKIVDNYKCLKGMNLKYLPVFDDPQVQPYLQYMYLARLYGFFLMTQTQIKTFSKTLIEQTIKNMNNVIQGKGPKLVFYSAHDITIAVILAALNFTTLDCLYQRYIMNSSEVKCSYLEYPSFGSSFIFELWQEDNGQHSIQVAINGKKYPIPVCKDKIICPLNQFTQWFNRNKLKRTPNQSCGIYPSVQNTSTYQLFLALALGMVICYGLFQVTIIKKEQHQRLSQEESHV